MICGPACSLGNKTAHMLCMFFWGGDWGRALLVEFAKDCMNITSQNQNPNKYTTLSRFYSEL